MNYFVHLTQSNTTINLAAITDVDWQNEPSEVEGVICTAAVTMLGGGGLLITEADAKQLWEAMTRYNSRVGQALAALPRLVEALAGLMDAEEIGPNSQSGQAAPPQVQRQAQVQSPQPGRVGPSGNGSSGASGKTRVNREPVGAGMGVGGGVGGRE